MQTKTIKRPSPEHPISITQNTTPFIVTVDGNIIAQSSRGVILKEASYPPIHYIPREDVKMDQLIRTEHKTYCPYKGECNYYSIPVGGDKATNAVWTYESPYPDVEAIKGLLAFYPDRVDSIKI